MASMYYFCTYFDKNYLPQGLALYESLKQHCSKFKLWVLCMDEVSFVRLVQLNLPEVELIALQDFEKGDISMLKAKQNRSQIEYYFTCTPSLPLYVLDHWPEVNLVTYLDADLFFFASPDPLFEELGAGSIAIIGHRFSEYMSKDKIYGIYNVGWVSFRRDINGYECLNWWRMKCIEWCYDKLDNGRFADQKYLNDWPNRFQNVVVIQHKGGNVAPWNVSNYCFRSIEKNKVMVDDNYLIFYHFHGLKKINRWMYDPAWTMHGITPSPILRNRVYKIYITCLENIRNQYPLLFEGGTSYSSKVRKKKDNIHSDIFFRGLRYIVYIFYVGRELLTAKYIFSLNSVQKKSK